MIAPGVEWLTTAVDTQDSKAERSRSAVWEVYDELRSARLNTKYYSDVLSQGSTLNLWLELVVAARPSTGIAGAWIFATAQGYLAWKTLGSVAAILAVYRAIRGHRAR